MTRSLEQRMEAMESYSEITELRARYCWHATRGEVAAVADLFIEDLEFIGPADAQGGRPTVHGREALLAYLQPSIAKKGSVVPLVTNHVIEIDGDEATGTCAMSSQAMPATDGGAAGSPSVFYYYDRFKRVSGRWYFAYRKLSLYSPVLQLDDERGANGKIGTAPADRSS